MKRFITLAILATTVAAAVPAMAAPAAGKWGLGYFRPEAPVGARIWFSEKAGLDVGVGFGSEETAVNTPSVPAGFTSETLTNYTVDIGIPFVVASTENAFFFVRPGFAYSSQDANPGIDTNGDGDDDIISPTNMALSADLGVEYFFNNNFSVQVAHGIVWNSFDADVQGVDSSTSFGTEDFGISNIGFHYYFK